jgi:hypothetical protein
MNSNKIGKEKINSKEKDSNKSNVNREENKTNEEVSKINMKKEIKIGDKDKVNKTKDKDKVNKTIVEHRYTTQKPIVDPSFLPGPSYPTLPTKHDQSPNKAKRIGNELIAKALMTHGGKIGKSAKALNLSHITLKRFIDKSPELKKLMEVSREAELEWVEDKFMDQIKLNNLTAQIFYLKCHGKNHGWIERPIEDNKVKKPSVTFKYTLVVPSTKRKVIDMGEIEEVK